MSTQLRFDGCGDSEQMPSNDPHSSTAYSSAMTEAFGERLRTAMLNATPVTITLIDQTVVTGLVQRVATSSAFAIVDGLHVPLDSVVRLS